MHLILIVTVMLYACLTASYNILGVFPKSSTALYTVEFSLMRRLSAEGHNVTVVSPFRSEKPIPNYRDIHIPGIGDVLKELPLESTWFLRTTPMQSINRFYQITPLFTNHTLTHPAMVEILSNEHEHFDVVIVDMILADALLGLGQHFNAPIIVLATYPTISITSLVRSPVIMSCIPNVLVGFTDIMSFGQRVDNTIISIFEETSLTNYNRIQEQIYNEAFPRTDKPNYNDVLKSVAVVLLNQHFITNVPRPQMPNLIEIGGFHIEKPKQLPVDIRDFVEGAEHGVVYISLGSHVSSTKFPQVLYESLFTTLRQLKQRVLWKWNESMYLDKPPNVMIKNWFPQNDVLAHPNVKLFITHGGIISINEAVYHGVPIVGVPFFGDQPMNTDRAVAQGIGLRIEHENLTVASLTWAIDEMLNNQKYAMRVKEMSKMYRDRPIEPMELATFWVEYVARRKGAPFMRSAAHNLSFLQYFSLDIFIVIIGTLLLWVYLVWITLTKICFRKSQTDVSIYGECRVDN